MQIVIEKRGSILSSKTEILINPVNIVGVMGVGTALAFRDKYPKCYKSYKKACNNADLTIGKIQALKMEDGHIIVNLPTKKHWKNPSRVEYIEASFKKLAQYCSARGVKKIAMPKVGCGLGGLNWEKDIYPLLDLLPYNLEIEVWDHS